MPASVLIQSLLFLSHSPPLSPTYFFILFFEIFAHFFLAFPSLLHHFVHYSSILIPPILLILRTGLPILEDTAGFLEAPSNSTNEFKSESDSHDLPSEVESTKIKDTYHGLHHHTTKDTLSTGVGLGLPGTGKEYPLEVKVNCGLLIEILAKGNGEWFLSFHDISIQLDLSQFLYLSLSFIFHFSSLFSSFLPFLPDPHSHMLQTFCFLFQSTSSIPFELHSFPF